MTATNLTKRIEMKFLKYTALIGLFGLLFFTACDPQEDPTPGVGPEPTAEDAKFSATPDASNPNLIHFKTSTQPFKALWDFGNGATGSGNEITGAFPAKGDYTVTLIIFTKGGQATSKQVVSIANTNPLMLNIPSYNFLTGGADALEGKTWIVDKGSPGNLALYSAATGERYYSAGPNEKDGKGLYDDEMTFMLADFAYKHVVNNNVYVNADYGSSFPGAVKENGGNDWIAPYEGKTSAWSLADNGDKTYTLSLSNGEFMGYYSGPVTSYTITALTADEMTLRSTNSTQGLVWEQRFIRKGFVREVVLPPYKIEDMHDDFEGSGNIVFADNSGGSLKVGYDNPATFGINTSAKVGKYIKPDGQSNEYSNVQTKFDFKMDLRDRHIFRLKAFIPGYNDYVTTGAEDWQSYKTLQKQVSIKLQNSELGGNAYTTQAEVIQSGLPTDEWVELTFDFTGAKDRTDFDVIVIQIGGEAIFTGGTFFIDDFELLPKVE